MKSILFHFFLAMLLLFSPLFGRGGVRCGTVQFAEDAKNPAKRLLARPGFTNCVPDNYPVFERRTRHFIIYYKTEGVHAIKTMAYIDSLAKYLEDAHKLFTDSLGMGYVLGASQTWHYQKRVPAGLYPVEVIDTGLLRDYEGEYSETYGLTFAPNSRSPRATQVVIENDFMHGADCTGKLSAIPFISPQNGDYSVKWPEALKITAYHELYHSFQLMYFDLSKHHTFWLEASAAGVEEIGAPEVNDYISYLSNVFNDPGRSMENSSSMQEYGHATLYLFLFFKLGPKFDSYIWNSFLKNPQEKFAVHLAWLAKSLDENPEDLFHEYARSVFFSGSRSTHLEATLFWPSDQGKWPAWRTNTTSPSVLPATTINFIRRESMPNTDSAKISHLVFSDTTIWILSRLLEKELPEPPKPPEPEKELTAFPNPWNPNKSSEFKFMNLPANSTGVEIRTSNGALLARVYKNEEGDTQVIWHPKKTPAPGILYYRALPHGKNKKLLVIY
ncbi:MAG: hypothetical protein LBC85_11385 [Fibromonadaceae bacterium]|jgi:hypothetical protein|nr:hypothetical protein [Fibromonadaceae bacterium]